MKLFDLLNEQEKKLFKIRHYDSNQVVFDEGSLCENIGIVLQGELLIKTYTYNIKEETITVVKENNLFGQFLIFSNNPFYLGIGITSKKTKIAFISKKNLLTLLSNNTIFLEKYLNVTCNETLLIKQQAKLLAHKNIRDRIMYYLNIHQKDKVVFIPSVTFLANTLSIPRPSISRELTNMEDEKLIKRIGKLIYIN